jgi:Flp pilus assembly protein TadG
MLGQLIQMPRSVRSRYRRRGGSAIVELSLTLLIMVNLSMGMVEFGYYTYVRNTMEGAAREGARNAIVPSSTLAGTTGVTAAISNVMSASGFASTSYSVGYAINGTTVSDPTTATSGQAVTVTVSGTWSTVGNGFRPMHFIAGTKVVKGVSMMRHE